MRRRTVSPSPFAASTERPKARALFNSEGVVAYVAENIYLRFEMHGIASDRTLDFAVNYHLFGTSGPYDVRLLRDDEGGAV